MTGYAVFWIITAVALGIIEAVTVNFITIWFAIGAVLAFLTAIFTDSVLVQLSVFIVASVVTLLLTKSLVRNLLKNKTVATNADRVINKKAFVTQTIDDISGTGQVKAMGQVWSAKTEDGVSINEGEEVIINKIEGVRAVVSKTH